jgi:hypothetical protein
MAQHTSDSTMRAISFRRASRTMPAIGTAIHNVTTVLIESTGFKMANTVAKTATATRRRGIVNEKRTADPV